jgi:hypothetical protein
VKVNIFELKEMEEDELLELANQTIASFPVLKEIYDEDFLKDLAQRRHHFDNYLLWLLVSKQSFTYSTWQTVANCLKSLEDSNSISHFKVKLRSMTDRVFRSYQTELEYAAYYKAKGYDIKLEPEIPNTGKIPEFKIQSPEVRVFFEVKSIFWEEIIEEEKLETQIQGAIGKINLPYVFNIRHTPGLSIEHVSGLKKLLIGRLGGLGDTQDFPLVLYYPSETTALAKITVLGKPNKLSHGYLGGISGRVKMGPGAEEVRRKISKKVSQLPKNEANVMVIERGSWLLDEIDIDYALFGDEKLRVYSNGHTEPIRAPNGILKPTKNTRLSAVIFSQKNWERQNFNRRKFVFHNPFAEKPLDEQFFADKDVQQFIPIHEEQEIRMVWK